MSVEPQVPTSHVPDDPLPALRAELDRLGEVDVAEHAAVYRRVNAAIAAELAALDEV